MANNLPSINLPGADLGKFAEPVTKFIEVVSTGMGILYEPIRIRNEARAKAEAARIMAEGDVEADLIRAKGAVKVEMVEMRSRARVNAWELRRQQNLEAIAGLAYDQLPGSVSSKKVNEDWIFQFFDSAKDVGDKEMQSLWARLLAGEIAEPESFSLRTLHTVHMLRSSDAALFQKFCCYLWKIGSELSHFWDVTSDEMLARKGLPFDGFLQLDSLGLIQAQGNIVLKFDESPSVMTYCNHRYELSWTGQRRVNIRVLTAVGHELAKLCDVEPDVEYREHWLTDMRQSGFQIRDLDAPVEVPTSPPTV